MHLFIHNNYYYDDMHCVSHSLLDMRNLTPHSKAAPGTNCFSIVPNNHFKAVAGGGGGFSGFRRTLPGKEKVH